MQFMNKRIWSSDHMHSIRTKLMLLCSSIIVHYVFSTVALSSPSLSAVTVSCCGGCTMAGAGTEVPCFSLQCLARSYER